MQGLIFRLSYVAEDDLNLSFPLLHPCDVKDCSAGIVAVYPWPGLCRAESTTQGLCMPGKQFTKGHSILSLKLELNKFFYIAFNSQIFEPFEIWNVSSSPGH